jgi:hypothetical protein
MHHECLHCYPGESAFRIRLLWTHICWKHFTRSGITLSSAAESCGNCCISVCFDGRVSLAGSLSFLHLHSFSCKLQLIERLSISSFLWASFKFRDHGVKLLLFLHQLPEPLRLLFPPEKDIDEIPLRCLGDEGKLMYELWTNLLRIDQAPGGCQDAIFQESAVDSLRLSLSIADTNNEEGILVESLGLECVNLMHVEHVLALWSHFDPHIGAI